MFLKTKRLETNCPSVQILMRDNTHAHTQINKKRTNFEISLLYCKEKKKC